MPKSHRWHPRLSRGRWLVQCGTSRPMGSELGSSATRSCAKQTRIRVKVVSYLLISIFFPPYSRARTRWRTTRHRKYGERERLPHVRSGRDKEPGGKGGENRRRVRGDGDRQLRRARSSSSFKSAKSRAKYRVKAQRGRPRWPATSRGFTATSDR